MGAVQTVGPDQLLEEVGRLVVHDGDVVGVPADGAAHVEHELRYIEQQGGYFIGHVLRLLIMACVKGVHHFAGGAVALVEVHGAHGIAFQAYAEELGFHAALHAGQFLLQNLVQGGGQQFPVILAVHGEVFGAVVYPDVHDARVSLGLSHGVGNVAAAFGMLNPELPDGFVRVGQGEVSALGMAEGGGVEIQLEVVGLGPVYPTLEMLRTALVAVYELAAEVSVNLMEIHAVVAGQQGFHEFEVFSYLVYVAGAAGIVAGGLDAAGQAVLAFKTDDVVGLPAVQGNLLLLQLGNGFVGVYAKGRIALFGYFVGLENLGFFHIGFVLVSVTRKDTL